MTQRAILLCGVVLLGAFACAEDRALNPAVTPSRANTSSEGTFAPRTDRLPPVFTAVLQDDLGKPLEGWKIDLETVGTSKATTGSDGRFSLYPARGGHLRFWPPADSLSLVAEVPLERLSETITIPRAGALAGRIDRGKTTLPIPNDIWLIAHLVESRYSVIDAQASNTQGGGMVAQTPLAAPRVDNRIPQAGEVVHVWPGRYAVYLQNDPTGDEESALQGPATITIEPGQTSRCAIPFTVKGRRVTVSLSPSSRTRGRYVMATVFGIDAQTGRRITTYRKLLSVDGRGRLLLSVRQPPGHWVLQLRDSRADGPGAVIETEFTVPPDALHEDAPVALGPITLLATDD